MRARCYYSLKQKFNRAPRPLDSPLPPPPPTSLSSLLPDESHLDDTRIRFSIFAKLRSRGETFSIFLLLSLGISLSLSFLCSVCLYLCVSSLCRRCDRFASLQRRAPDARSIRKLIRKIISRAPQNCSIRNRAV